MKRKNIIYLLAFSLVALFATTSCNKFLDELPDNRTEVDSPEKITKLLVTAYTTFNYAYMCELASDNVDDFGITQGYEKWEEECFNWKDHKSISNESVIYFWEGAYKSIAAANQALDAIKKLEAKGDPRDLRAQKGEALIARAYNHFMLANVYCQRWNPENAHLHLGIPYMETSETSLRPSYERGTLQGVYDKVQRDLEEGLPLINDAIYSVPKYHFNRQAAHAFATRFYLYIRDFDKAIHHATEVLGPNPAQYLRDWDYLAESTLGKIMSMKYISHSEPANLLITTGYSRMGAVHGAYLAGMRFAHGSVVAQETCYSEGPWGKSPMGRSLYKVSPISFGTSIHKVLAAYKFPYLFEFKDAYRTRGYLHSIFNLFTTDEVLIDRAEAYVWKEDYDKAVSDLNLWRSNIMKAGSDMNTTNVEEFYGPLKFPYYNADQSAWEENLGPSPRKKITLPPGVNWSSSSPDTQEAFIHCVLHCRRIQTVHEGKRWFDIKRYGIEIQRREFTRSNTFVRLLPNKLEKYDLRRTFQIPPETIEAGLQKNIRDVRELIDAEDNIYFNPNLPEFVKNQPREF